MFEEYNDQEKNEWYIKHTQEQLKKGNYHDPCKNCSAEDCCCCSYGKGY